MPSPDKRFLLGLVVGAILGGALMFVLGDAPGARLEAQASLAPDGLVPKQRDGKVPLPNPAGPLARSLSPAASGPAVDKSELQSMLASLERVPLALTKGAGVIHGHVRDRDGDGVAGVLIRLGRVSAPSPGTSPAQLGVAAPVDETLGKIMREAAQHFRDSQASRYETQTDANGAYRVENLGPHKWKAEAYLAHYLVESEGASYAVRPGSKLNFTATRLVDVQVAVLAPDGSPAPGATLQTELDGERTTRRRYSWSPAEAFLRLVPGTYEIVAYSQGNTPPAQASAPQSVTIAKDTPALRFELCVRREIRGRVSRAQGDPPADRFRVRLLALTPTQKVDLALLASATDSAWIREGAEYSFQDLEAGRYVVGAGRSYNSPIAVQRVVEVTEGTLQCDLQIPAIDRSRMLRVRVLGSDGQALKDVSFQLGVTRPRHSHSGGASPLREKDGTYLIRFNPADEQDYFGEQATDVEFTLFVSHQDYGSTKVILPRGQTERSVSFASPGVLRVRVAGYAGSGYEGRLRVSARKLEGKSTLSGLGSSKQAFLNPDGVATLEALDPGRYRVQLGLQPKKNSDQWFQDHSIDALEIEILAGDNNADLSIPALYSLRVHWADGKPGSGIYLRALDAGGQRTTNFNADLDPNGFAEYEEVPAGDYTLTGGGSGTLQMTLTVPAGSVEFEPLEVNAMRLQIFDRQGDLSQIGFEDGDLILGRDGVPFAGPPDSNLWGGLMTTKDAEGRFSILRGTQHLEILVKGSDLGNWQDLGGRLMFAVH